MATGAATRASPVACPKRPPPATSCRTTRLHPFWRIATSMFRQLFIAWCLMAACVVIHAYGVVSALQWLRRRKVPDGARLAPWMWVFIVVAGWMIVLHVAEIVVWDVAST